MPSLAVAKWFLVPARVLPVLVIVVLSAPAWLLWVFLPTARQEMVLKMVKELGAWTCAMPTPETGPPEEELRLPRRRRAVAADPVIPRPPAREGRRRGRA